MSSSAMVRFRLIAVLSERGKAMEENQVQEQQVQEDFYDIEADFMSVADEIEAEENDDEKDDFGLEDELTADDEDGEEDERPEPEETDDDDDGVEEDEGTVPEQQPSEPKKKLSGKERIQQLVEQKNELKKQLAEAQLVAEEATKKYVVSTPEGEDPEKKLAELKEQYANMPTVQGVLEREIVNPDTGDIYTPAEAAAAIANLKQDVMFQINNTNEAVVAKLEQSRHAESLGNELGNELSELIARHPELDPEAANYNKVWGRILTNEIKANEIKSGALLTGWAESPAKFVAEFEKAMISATTVVANKVSKVNANVDKTKSIASPKQDAAAQTGIDAMMAAFDAELGL
jgi:hypothetical protein